MARLRDDPMMKRAQAIGRVGDVVEALDLGAGWRDQAIIAGFVFGALVDGDDEFDHIELALVVDEPPEGVPWMARPAPLESLAALLGFSKLPLSWRWRPAAWPVWNHAIARAAPIWRADTGRDQSTLDALAAGRLDEGVLHVAPDGEALLTQVRIEHAVGRRHLETVTELFYDRDWQRAHRGDGVYPQDHLWWAAAGFVDLDNALHGLA